MPGANTPGISAGQFLGLGAAQAGFNMLGSIINNGMSTAMGDYNRKQNYLYNEKSANAADARTRALYNDLYSPKALLQQYKDAGLSPSLMFGGGGPGGATPQGAQGEGASGLGVQTFGINPVDIAQTKLANAQAENIEADTKIKEKDADLKDIEKDCAEIDKQLKLNEYSLTNSYIIGKDGNKECFMDIAEKNNTFQGFIHEIRERAHDSNNIDLQHIVYTQQGWNILKEMYITSKEYNTKLNVLAQESSSAKLSNAVNKALEQEGFPQLSAESQVNTLKRVAEDEGLTGRELETWNSLLDDAKKKGNFWEKLLIILAAIFNKIFSRTSVNLKNK